MSKIIEGLAHRFITMHALTWDKTRQLAQEWAGGQNFYGNPLQWERNCRLLEREMSTFCSTLGAEEKLALLESEYQVNAGQQGTIRDLAHYLLVKALAGAVWAMVEEDNERQWQAKLAATQN